MKVLRLFGASALVLVAALAISSRRNARADDDAGLDAGALHVDDGIYRLDGATEAGLAKQEADSGCAVGGHADAPPFALIALVALAVVTRRRR